MKVFCIGFGDFFLLFTILPSMKRVTTSVESHIRTKWNIYANLASITYHGRVL
jgi:hypothetical protein